jgi:hypothetical protein
MTHDQSALNRQPTTRPARPATTNPAPLRAGQLDPCVICGSDRVVERRCKVICLHCGTILQSCADL